MTRLPERDLRAQNEHTGLIKWHPSNALIAVIFLLVFTLGPYLAFTKHVPFTSYGYTLHATFSNAVNIATRSPVRIAGVEVGAVTSTERDGNNTSVTFTVDDSGRPIHSDAFAQIRPRIFLEGNFFIDLDPGSPSAPEMGSGGTIPITHTSTAVQFDEILTALQSPVRADLSRLLESYGTALTHQPTAAEDVTQEPEVQGKTAAEALNGAFKYGGDAGRYSAQVTNALLGTQAGDLSRLVAGAGRTFGALAHNEADLQGLIVNFDTFTGALAAQSSNLATTVQRFAPFLQTARASLVSLNRTLPPLRAWAIELTPSLKELPGLIAASGPFLKQARPLLSGKEGGGVAKLLAKSTPGLAPPLRPARRTRCRSSTSSASAPRASSSRPATRRSTISSAPVAPATASSSTGSPSSPGRAKTSTAMAPSCACSQVAARSSPPPPTPTAISQPRRTSTPTRSTPRSAFSPNWAAGRRRRSPAPPATSRPSPTSTARSASPAPPTPRR